MRYMLTDNNGALVARCATMAKVLEYIDRQRRSDDSCALWLHLPSGKIERVL